MFLVTVAITGAAGLLGSRLLPRLLADDQVERVIAFDLRRPDGPTDPRVTFHAIDVRDPRMAELVEGADVVVHLGWQLDPIRDEVRMRSINVEGTRNVLDSAIKAGAGKIVYASSATVYGAHPDNDFPLTEDSPLRPNPELSYVAHKAEVEEWLWPWVEQHPDVVVTVLRPAVVAGPGVENFITRQMEAPRFIAVRDHHPPVQFAHVDDVVDALALAVRTDLPGAFNVACEGWLSYDEVVDLVGVRTVEVPEAVAFELADRLWRYGVSHAPPGQVHYVMHPWVLSVDKLREAGWEPRHANRETLDQLLEEHRAWLTLARGVRVRRRDVRTGAAVAGGAAAALLIRRARRRSR